MKLSAAEDFPRWALSCESGNDILARAQEFVQEVAPGLFENNG